jgi:hypothetical protein
VRDASGNVPSETKIGVVQYGNWAEMSRLPPGEIDLGGSGACFTLKSDRSLTEDVSIIRLYDLSNPGKYAIQLRRLVEDIGTFVKSNTITVTVTPEEKRHASTLCAGLAFSAAHAFELRTCGFEMNYSRESLLTE